MTVKDIKISCIRKWPAWNETQLMKYEKQKNKKQPHDPILYFTELESVSLNMITQISFDYDFIVIQYFGLLCSYFFLTKPQYYWTALYQYKTY